MICPGRGISDREVAGMTQLWMGLLSDVSDTGIEQSVGSVRGLWAILYSNSILREKEREIHTSHMYIPMMINGRNGVDWTEWRMGF